MSRPAPRRHRAARLLALTSGPPPTAKEAVDVRPKPELFSSLLLTQRGRGVRYSHVYFSRFYEPGARLAFARPTTPSKPVRPHGTQLSEISVLLQAYSVGSIGPPFLRGVGSVYTVVSVLTSPRARVARSMLPCRRNSI